MNDKSETKIGIVHGRFQPPHNGHINYILTAIDKCEHLIIGICTPNICTEEESLKTGFPCTQKLNPFSHKDREIMITLSLDEKNIPREKYSFVDFPSDYKNIQNLIPKDSVFFISRSSNMDDRKKVYIESLGYKTESIIIIDGERIESGQNIRASIEKNDGVWKSLVPHPVQEYITNKNLI